MNSSKENIDWDENSVHFQKQKSGNVPDAKYGSLSESMRHSLPENRVCAMFCGGNKCKYCNPEHCGKWKKENMEVKGLFSNWVTDKILAMSRPTTKAIEEFSILQQFKDLGIKSIINLQLPGEHYSCGFGNEEEGFSYSPQVFMDNDIFFYNFGWQDYGIGSLTNIMDMVKVMQFALSEGKVSIHCHAGLGRTGVLIACYLLYANRMDPHEAIHYIRSKRPGAIQTRTQILCIEEFSQFLRPLFIVYSSIDEEHNDFTLTQFLVRQRYILHGEEARKLKYIPKLIFLICERLLEIAHRGKHHIFKSTFSIMQETAPKAFNNTLNTHKSVENGTKSTSHLDHGSEYSSSTKNVLVSNLSEPNIIGVSEVRESFTALPHRSSTQSSITSINEYLMDDEEEADYSAADPQAQMVAEALVKCTYSEEENQTIAHMKDLINTDSEQAYHRMSTSDDVVMLSALMWFWLDELREPILHPQDMPNMLEYANKPIAGILTLEKGAKETIQCIFTMICKLQPMSEQLLQDILCRALSTLTHQNMVISPSSNMLLRTSNQTGLMRSTVANRLLMFFISLLEEVKDQIHQHAVKHREKQQRDL